LRPAPPGALACAKRMKVLLIIPAYNEAANIERVIDELTVSYPEYDYVIVNDGSTDATEDVCRNKGYRVITLPVNLGLAGAFQTGMQYALEHGYDCAIQFDADGQHRPEYLGTLSSALDASDIAIGSRCLNGQKLAGLRSVGSALLSGAIRLTTGQRLTDPTSGMRAYGTRAIRELAHGPNLGPEPDTIAYLMRKRSLNVAEVPVEIADRIAGKSYLNYRYAALYMTRMMVSILFVQFFRR